MKKKKSVGRKMVIAAAVLVLAVIGLVAAGLIYLNHYLNTEGFRTRLEDEIRQRAGVELTVGDISASIFTGFTVRELSVASPAEGDPPLFQAAEIVLKYNLSHLLARKVTVDRVEIVSPRIRLRTDAEGEWVLPVEMDPEPEVKPPPVPEREPEPVPPEREPKPAPPAVEPGWEIAVDSFRIADGSAEFFTGEDYDPVEISGLNLSGRFLGRGDASEIEALLEIASVDFGGERIVERFRADLVLKGMESLTADLRSGLAGGRVTGGLSADLEDPDTIPYQTGLNLEEVDIVPLVRTFAPDLEMEVTGGVFGHLQAVGVADDPDSLRARGNLEIREGTLSGNPVQDLIAGLLRDEELKKIEFEQTEAVFNLSGRLATLERLIVHSRKTILAASGTVDLERDSELDLLVGVNLHQDLVGEIRVRELRDAFQPSEDFPGYRVFDFKVWGTPDDLRNDFAQRLIRRGAVPRLKEELLGRDREDEPESDRRREKREKQEGTIEEGVDRIFRLFGQ